MARLTAPERAEQVSVATAELVMSLCEQAGVSKSPTAVRYELAAILRGACSQRTIRDLRERLTAATR